LDKISTVSAGETGHQKNWNICVQMIDIKPLFTQSV